MAATAILVAVMAAILVMAAVTVVMVAEVLVAVYANVLHLFLKNCARIRELVIPGPVFSTEQRI
jgi:hypothetical protein